MTRRSFTSATLLSVALMGFAPRSEATPSVDPNVIRALDLGSIPMTRTRSFAPQRDAPVLIELDRPLSAAVRTRFVKAGVEPPKRAGRAVGLERFVATRLDRAALAKLATMPEVLRISYVPPRGPLPLEHTTGLLNLASARGAHASIDQLTGYGMLVADTDSNADVFHPHFFHADGGYYDWIDVDEDGLFSPDKDAIDFDADTTVSTGEVGRVVTAATYNYYSDLLPARDVAFDPGLDWIYLDDNENGKRDYGAGAGFDDSALAFGEPLFVPDDVNQNGQLDVGERFVRLGTSKFRKVYKREYEGMVYLTHVYERGVDMTAYDHGTDSHATGVMSILMGDVPLMGRRNVGVAPEAEGILSVDRGDAAMGPAWMLDEKPDVALWEMAPWTGMPLDGSDPYSQLVDATREIAHACPVGNTGGSRKHARVQLPAGQTTTLALENPPDLDATYLQVSLNIRGAQDLTVHLEAPDGTDMDLTGAAGQQLEPIPGIIAYSTVQTSTRGTYFVDVILGVYAKNLTIPEGSWQLSIEGHQSDDAMLDAYVMDEKSGWSQGVAFSEAESTDESTLGAPAVADHAIAVGAFTGHSLSEEEPWFKISDEPTGHVRFYSGRGPRIDGAPRLDIVAPDNPFAAAPYIKDDAGYGFPHGAFSIFGGTSGAGPHVAGVATLLAQTGIRGDKAREALRQGAISDAQTLAAPNDYGAGRLNAAGALGIEPTAAPPTVSVEQDPSPAVVGEKATLRLTLADAKHPASSLVTRWDEGYDGTWDTSYTTATERTVMHDEVGRYPYKVRVRNPGGRVAEAVIWVNVAASAPQLPDAGDSDGASPEGGIPEGGEPRGPNLAATPGGGCGCRVADTQQNDTPLLSLLGLVAVTWLRRRSVARSKASS